MTTVDVRIILDMVLVNDKVESTMDRIRDSIKDIRGVTHINIDMEAK